MPNRGDGGPDAHFNSTSWSVIAAAKGAEEAVARSALEGLCRQYWAPLYTYVRLKGYNREDAEDLTQEFFARLLARDFLARVDRSFGKFRAFLLACLNNFLANEWDRRTAARRGGAAPVALDFERAERQYGLLPQTASDATMAFDTQWAETLMATAERRLEAEYRQAAKSALFEALAGFLGCTGAPGEYAEIAKRLGMREGAVRVATHRLRKRFAELVRGEIAATVESEADVQEELDHLIRVLSARP